MKAARFHSPGGPEVLSYEDAPTPVPGPSEVLLKVTACGVNRIDIWARSGRYKTHLPHILGTDVAGVVASGQESEVETGSPFLVYPVISDGTCVYCLKGSPNLCVSRGFVGTAIDGGYAEFVKVPTKNLIPAKGVDTKIAATLPVNFGTAWSGLASRAKVGPDDTVLIWGAAGGLGYAAVQVAKFLGARVIAAIGDDAKSYFVRTMGADHVVNHNSQDIVETVHSLTEGLGVSVVFDHVGGDTWARSLASLSRGGRMVTLGLTSGAKSEVDVRRIYQNELSVIGTYGQSKGDIEQVLRLAADGKLRPSVYKELPLSSAREAQEIIESREVQGKILLLP